MSLLRYPVPRPAGLPARSHPHSGSRVIEPAAHEPVSVTSGLATLTLTGQAPVVTTTANVWVTAGTATLTLTGYAPTVTTGGNVSVTAGTATLTLTGQAPAVSEALTAGQATLTLTGQPPLVEIGNQPGGNWLIEPGTATLTLTAQTPTVATTANVFVTAGTATLTLTGQTPTVVASASVEAGTATLTLTGQAPTVSVPVLPILSSATATVTSRSGANGSVDTDTGDGTLYWVVTRSATSPTVAQVQAGQDHNSASASDSGSQAVSATGTQNVTASGLNANRSYYFHFQHRNAASDDSAVLTGSSWLTFSQLITATQGTLFDSFVQTADTESYSCFSGDDEQVAQSWQSDATPVTVAGGTVRLFRSGSPTGSIRLRIETESGVYGTSSVPDGTQRAISLHYDVADLLSGSANAANYFFPLNWTPDASTDYTVIADCTNVTGDISNYVGVVVESGAEATHGGNAAVEAGAGWNAVGANDMVFAIYESADVWRANATIAGSGQRRRTGVLVAT